MKGILTVEQKKKPHPREIANKYLENRCHLTALKYGLVFLGIANDLDEHGETWLGLIATTNGKEEIQELNI